jgi:proline racemase
MRVMWVEREELGRRRVDVAWGAVVAILLETNEMLTTSLSY